MTTHVSGGLQQLQGLSPSSATSHMRMKRIVTHIMLCDGGRSRCSTARGAIRLTVKRQVCGEIQLGRRAKDEKERQGKLQGGGDYASLMLLRNESVFVVGKCASEAVLNGTRAFRNRPLGA
jgi:hypothetical protein